MTHVIHIEKDFTVCFELGLYFYIDTNVKLDKKIVGVFSDNYDVSCDDFVRKKFKFLKNRDNYPDNRYLHAVRKDRKESVEKLCKKFEISVPVFKPQKDRVIVYKDKLTIIMEYNPGVSYAVFTTFDKLENHLKEKKTMWNNKLTGLDGISAPGFVISAKKALANNYIDSLVNIAKQGVKIYEGNEIQQDADSIRGNKVFTIWGETIHLSEKLVELQCSGSKLHTLDAKALPDGRVYYTVEVIPEEE